MLFLILTHCGEIYIPFTLANFGISDGSKEKFSSLCLDKIKKTKKKEKQHFSEASYHLLAKKTLFNSFLKLSICAGFFLLRDDGGGLSPLAENLLIPPTWKNFPHQITIFMLPPSKNFIFSCSRCSCTI